MDEYQIRILEIAKLDLKPEDVLVVKLLGQHVRKADLEQAKAYLREALPQIETIVFAETYAELSVIHPSATASI